MGIRDFLKNAFGGKKQDVESLAIERFFEGNDSYFGVVGIGNCTSKDVVIPAEYDGLPVRYIEENAFKNCASIESITIPDSVNYISSFAFQGCTSLKEINIPFGVRLIREGTFNGCTSLERVVLPSSVEEIGLEYKPVFEGCASLKEIVIPDNAKIDESKLPEGCKIISRSDYIKTQNNDLKEFKISYQRAMDMTAGYGENIMKYSAPVYTGTKYIKAKSPAEAFNLALEEIQAEDISDNYDGTGYEVKLNGDGNVIYARDKEDRALITHSDFTAVDLSDLKTMYRLGANGAVLTEPAAPAERRNPANAAKEIRSAMVAELIEYIKKDPQNWQRGWVNGYPENGQTGRTYRGINLLYLSMVRAERGYNDSRWVTFEQAKNLKASVKKGEKSVPIVFYTRYDRQTKKPFDEATVKDMSNEEKAEYMEKNVYSVLKYSRVFNAEQCLNFPAAEEMTDEEHAKNNAKIESIIANSAAPIYYDGNGRAYYNPTSDSIHLPPIKDFKTKQDYYATALHEIAHSTGHESRLDRKLNSYDRSDKEKYAVEELRAEIASVLTQGAAGLTLDGNHFENHAAYLNSWLSVVEKDNNILLNAIYDAEDISDYIVKNYMKEQESTKETETVAAAPAAEKPVEPAEPAAQPIKSTISEEKPQSETEEPEQPAQNRAEAPKSSRSAENGAQSGSGAEKVNLASEWRYINLVPSQIGKTYDTEKGSVTQIVLPDGEYSKYSVFVNSKLVHTRETKNGGTRTVLSLNEKNTYTAKRDGMEVKMTGAELATAFNGGEVGKKAERVAPSWKNAQRYKALDENVPDEMKQLPNWVCYKTWWDEKKQKFDKRPVSAVTGEYAKSNDPATWTTFGEAMKFARENNLAGLGFALDGKCGISCIDLDKSIDQNGNLNAPASKLCAELEGKTYTETSVSGNGLHIFVKDDILQNGKYQQRGEDGGAEIEVYDKGRIISMTGNLRGNNNSLGVCPSAAMQYLRTTLKQVPQAVTRPAPRKGSEVPKNEREVEDKILKSANREDYLTLKSGGTLNAGDRSRDDWNFLKIIAFYSNCDRDIMRSMFMDSALYRPTEKSASYLDRSIDNVIARQTRTLNDGLFTPSKRFASESKKGKGAHP